MALAVGWPGHVAAGRAASTDYTFVSFGNYYATSINAGGYVLLNRSRGGAMDSSQVWHDGISQTVIPDDPPSHGLNDDRVFDISDSGLISGTDLSPDFYPQPSTWRTSAPSAGTVLPAAANRLDYAGWVNSRGDVIGVGEVPVPTNSYASQSYLFPQGGAPVPIGNGFGQLSTESDHTWVCGLSETGEILAGIYRSATGVNGLYLLPSANATPAMSTKLDFAAGACNGIGLYPNAHPMSRNGTVVVGRLRRNPDGTETTIGTSDFAAASVNDSGAVAGCINGCQSGALVADGVQTPLASLLPSGWKSMLPAEINDNGDIVGYCTANDSSLHGCLLKHTGTLTLTGTVTDTKGKPVSGATVTVTGTDTDGVVVATSAVTANDGVYGMSLADGSYDFDVRSGPTPTGQADGGTWTTTACAGPGPVTPGTCHLDVTSATRTLPGFGYGLPDLQAENVEISQGIQSETWDDTSGAYTGVPLVRDVPTVVRVYASVVADGAPPAPPDVTAVPAQLHGYTAAGTELAGSPVSATARTLHSGPSLPAARTQAADAYIFTLPPAWTQAGPIKLTADVDPKVADARPIHECKDCDANDTFSLGPVTFATVAPLTIRPFAISYRYKPANPLNDWLPESAPNLSALFDRAKDVLPIPTGGLVIQPFPQATLDITADVTRVLHAWRNINHVALKEPDLSDCIAITNCRKDLQTLEIAAIHRSITLTHDAHTFTYGFEPIPDGYTAPALGLSVAGTHPTPRPLTSTAHEFMHLLGFQHASPCGGGGSGGEADADWPPDQQGYIQGVGLDRRPNSAGAGLYKIIAAGVGNAQWYDLMSYCANIDDSDSWISTINWTKFVQERSTPVSRTAPAAGLRTASGASTRISAPRAAPATGPRLAVDASIENGKVKLLGAGEIDAATTVSHASAYHFKVLGKNGHVMANIGVVPETLDDSSAVLLSANLPAKGVTAVQVTKGIKVVATQRKPTPGPRVTLAVPRRSGGKLALRWKAHGARGVTLTSTIQVRTKTGWQTLIAGLTTTRYTAKVPKPTTVRIAVNDGFTTITSNARKR